MSFIVKSKVVNKSDEQSFTHDSGLSITVKPFNTPNFQKAYSLIMSKQAADGKQELTVDALRAISSDTLSYDEAIIVAMGEHLLTSWNAVNENGEPLPLSGDNLLLLLSQVERASDIIQWMMKCASDLVSEQIAEAAAIKKKPSTGTSGKKNTAT